MNQLAALTLLFLLVLATLSEANVPTTDWTAINEELENVCEKPDKLASNIVQTKKRLACFHLKRHLRRQIRNMCCPTKDIVCKRHCYSRVIKQGKELPVPKWE
uniref:Conserved secreted protein n=1 Tax=Steinernema glaseri TaxID=37863 RepID=A0A1I7YI46_9BILA